MREATHGSHMKNSCKKLNNKLPYHPCAELIQRRSQTRFFMREARQAEQQRVACEARGYVI